MSAGLPRTALWAELPSPVKADFRNAFRRFADTAFSETGCILRDYVPAGMGAEMPREDYLLFMPEEELPDCLLTMAYGECSSPAFMERFLESGIYDAPEPFAFFPELMVLDKKRLSDCGLAAPRAYEDLSSPRFHGELCLIGSRGRPDPMLPLYCLGKQGTEGMRGVLANVNALAGPSSTLRVLGLPSNRFGSVFVMPAYFASIAAGRPYAEVLCPETGALAEPVLCFFRRDADLLVRMLIRRFLASAACRAAVQEFLVPAQLFPLPVDAWCREHLLYPELADLL